MSSIPTPIAFEAAATSQLPARGLRERLRRPLLLAVPAVLALGPADWIAPDFDLADFTLPSSLPVSLPAELAHDRPDILEAEAELHAASAAIGIATANLYPHLKLNREGFHAGEAGVLQVLDAERAYQRALLGQIGVRTAQYLDTAELCVALGGNSSGTSDSLHP